MISLSIMISSNMQILQSINMLSQPHFRIRPFVAILTTIVQMNHAAIKPFPILPHVFSPLACN